VAASNVIRERRFSGLEEGKFLGQVPEKREKEKKKKSSPAGCLQKRSYCGEKGGGLY